MANSAFKKWILNITAGSITTGTFAVVGLGTVHYQKVGKYYSNIWVQTGGGTQFFPSDSTNAKSLLATAISSALGVTVNTWYSGTNYGAYTRDSSTGATWDVANTPTNTTRTFILGFITN